MTLAEALKAWRLEHGLTQQDIADAIGVARESVWQWEAGRPPYPKYRVALIELVRKPPPRREEKRGRPRRHRRPSERSGKRYAACFDDEDQYREWWILARQTKVTSICVDCDLAYQAEMKAEGRCAYPDVTPG